MEQKDFKYIVRVVNTDLDGNKPIEIAMRKIKGVNFMFANIICYFAGVDNNKKTGYLLDGEIKKLDDVLKNPLKYNIPSWMLNRRKDYEEGTDKHILTSDIKFVQENDLKRLKKIKSYRGMRHAYGLPTRGQRTKSNFRKNKGKVTGVKRKKGKSGKA
ncbi:30S ribosomal protein S13 [Candidatus Woesearchaeota archaeon]|nr:30S ribosomal protein S13 [Candidatus Woesearchaeota archaeon]